jgi:hypothetical protein
MHIAYGKNLPAANGSSGEIHFKQSALIRVLCLETGTTQMAAVMVSGYLIVVIVRLLLTI